MPGHAPGVVSRVIEGEAVLVHPAQGKVRVLNQVGSRLWELMDGKRTTADLANLLVAEYQVDPAQAQAHTVAFCTDLLGRGLLILGP